MVITLGRPDASETATAYNLLGNMASEEGDHQEALAHYNMAISITPENAVFYFNRAVTFYDLDDNESAIADLNVVLELSEDAEVRAKAEEWLSVLE
jgi:tetratricopeptide (TPR) repeat protein